MIMRDMLPQFQNDYLISWDFSDKDLPCVAVSKVKRDGATIVAEIIGRSHERTGCVSILQTLADYENRQREEKKRVQWLQGHIKQAGEAIAKASGAATKATEDFTKTVGGFDDIKEDSNL